jgi:hypothetical protein
MQKVISRMADEKADAIWAVERMPTVKLGVGCGMEAREVEKGAASGEGQTCPCGGAALGATGDDGDGHDVSSLPRLEARGCRGRLSMARAPQIGQTRRSMPVSARSSSRQEV